MSFYDLKRIEEEEVVTAEDDDDYDDYDEYDYDDYDTACSICGGEQLSDDDWNPQTGNHQSCDARRIIDEALEGI